MSRRRPFVEPEEHPVPPLTPAAFEILVALTEEALHGYAILQAVNTTKAEDEGGGPELLPGTLYRALSRLVDAGLLREVERADPCEDQRRRYYALTTLGREALGAEARRLARRVELARARGLLPDGGASR